MAAGRADRGRPGFTPADEGWLAADRGRLRGRDLRGRLPALTPSRLAMGAAAVALLLAAAVAPAADPEAGRRKAQVCAACHGPDGNATIPGTPSLAGQPVFFTHWQLIKYRDGRRKDPQMSPLAEKLDDADMADLAAFYAAQPARGRPAATDPARVAAGAEAAWPDPRTRRPRPGVTGQRHSAPLAAP